MDKRWDRNPHPAAMELLSNYKASLDKTMGEVIGHSRKAMKKGSPESLLSNFLTDALRESAGRLYGRPVDMALLNLGGLRTSLPRGGITVGMIYEVLPFDNKVCVLTLRGTDIQRLCAGIARSGGEGVSGLRMDISRTGKLLRVEIGGLPLQPDKLYTLATLDFLAEGNDGMTALMQAQKNVLISSEPVRTLIIDHIRRLTAEGSPLQSQMDGRISVR